MAVSNQPQNPIPLWLSSAETKGQELLTAAQIIILLMRIMICSCVYLNSKCIEIYAAEPVFLNVHPGIDSKE
jgi:hypothetical protein